MNAFHAVETGVFGKPHGIRGEISAFVDVDGLDIEPGDFVFADIDNLTVPFRVTGVRTKGAGYLLALRGINNENDAAMLAGKALMMQVDLADGDDHEGSDSSDFYLEDLIGFVLMNSDGVRTGVIADYDASTGDNPLFVVESPSGSEILIPAAPDLITDIRTDEKIIVMDLPAGLINLN